MSAKDIMDERQGRRRRKRSEPEEVIEADDELEEDEERGLSERKGRATRGRRAQTEIVETGNFVTRPLRRIAGYLDSVRGELIKVTWPTRQETFDLSRIVLATTIAAALILGLISLFFGELLRIGLDAPIILVGVIVLAIIALAVYIRSSSRGTSSY